ILEILDKPGGSWPANIGLAGCADIVTFTFFTHGSTATTSFACFSNYIALLCNKNNSSDRAS
ncbi:hypothetical protein F2Q70_00033239, partial [Brassica cretica]